MPIRLLDSQHQCVLDTNIDVEIGLYYPLIINCGDRLFYRHQFAPIDGKIKAVYQEVESHSIDCELLSL